MTIDKIYDRLVAAQRPVTRYLWTPADAVTFTPAIVKKALGDGRALFSVWTTNDRPQYWLVRGDSQWSCGDYAAPDDATYIGEMWNEILDAIVEEFGRSRCGYSGSACDSGSMSGIVSARIVLATTKRGRFCRRTSSIRVSTIMTVAGGRGNAGPTGLQPRPIHLSAGFRFWPTGPKLRELDCVRNDAKACRQ